MSSAVVGTAKSDVSLYDLKSVSKSRTTSEEKKSPPGIHVIDVDSGEVIEGIPVPPLAPETFHNGLLVRRTESPHFLWRGRELTREEYLAKYAEAFLKRSREFYPIEPERTREAVSQALIFLGFEIVTLTAFHVVLSHYVGETANGGAVVPVNDDGIELAITTSFASISYLLKGLCMSCSSYKSLIALLVSFPLLTLTLEALAVIKGPRFGSVCFPISIAMMILRFYKMICRRILGQQVFWHQEPAQRYWDHPRGRVYLIKSQALNTGLVSLTAAWCASLEKGITLNSAQSIIVTRMFSQMQQKNYKTAMRLFDRKPEVKAQEIAPFLHGTLFDRSGDHESLYLGDPVVRLILEYSGDVDPHRVRNRHLILLWNLSWALGASAFVGALYPMAPPTAGALDGLIALATQYGGSVSAIALTQWGTEHVWKAFHPVRVSDVRQKLKNREMLWQWLRFLGLTVGLGSGVTAVNTLYLGNSQVVSIMQNLWLFELGYKVMRRMVTGMTESLNGAKGCLLLGASAVVAGTQFATNAVIRHVQGVPNDSLFDNNYAFPPGAVQMNDTQIEQNLPYSVYSLGIVSAMLLGVVLVFFYKSLRSILFATHNIPRR